MNFEEIRYEVADHVLTITLDRPDRLNAFTPTMGRELIEAFDQADADDDVHAIVVTGEGRGFCAGADLGGGGGTFDDTGFQVTFGGTLAGLDQPALILTVTGGTGFVGETAHGGPPTNNGFIVVDTGNHAPDVTAPAAYTIPPRTPFAPAPT